MGFIPFPVAGRQYRLQFGKRACVWFTGRSCRNAERVGSGNETAATGSWQTGTTGDNRHEPDAVRRPGQ